VAPEPGQTAVTPPIGVITWTTAMHDLVTVATFPDVAEAELAKERLKLEGIQAFVIDAAAVGVMPYLANAMGGVRVQVDPGDAARAKEILGVE